MVIGDDNIRIHRGEPLPGGKYELKGIAKMGYDIRAHLERNGWDVESVKAQGNMFGWRKFKGVCK